MASPVQYHLGKFPPQDLNWQKLIPLIGPANAALARYDGTLNVIPNPQVLLTPLITQEAVLSSKIEGTQATMGEVFEYEADADEEKFSEERKEDIHEIINYRRALNHAISRLDELPLCTRIIKESHEILMQGVRGQSKFPGEFRKTANWIGAPGCTIEEAKFVPVSNEHLVNAMSEWEKYLHAEEPDHLVQLALIHAEFEALHPFLDGNGRLGRMIIPLFLYKANILQKPVFYISAYFERHRDLYYEKLLAVSRDNDWTGFVYFFLDAIIKQAKENQDKAIAILNLYEQKKQKVQDLTHSQYAINALDFLFCRPIFSSVDFVNSTGMSQRTANRLLRILHENGIIKVVQEASGSRSAKYVFKKLLNLVEGEEIF